MEKIKGYRGAVKGIEGALAVVLVAVWSIGSIVLVGAQSLPAA